MPRLIGGTGCHAAEMSGALMLALGHIAGLYLAAVAMVISQFEWPRPRLTRTHE
jgi:hypothetical protein